MVYQLSDFQPVDCNPGIHQSCRLLSLPPELRLQIFAYVLPHRALVLPQRHHPSSGSDLYGSTWEEVKASLQVTQVYHVHSKAGLGEVGLLQVCRQIYAESAPLLYSACIFNITVRWDGAHLLASTLDHCQPLAFRQWPTGVAGLMRKLHVDVPILSKRTYDARVLMFEAYVDVRRHLRVLVDQLQAIPLQELTVDCFYLACWLEEEELSHDRLNRGIRETLHAFRSLRGLRKVVLRLHVLDWKKRAVYQLGTAHDRGDLSTLRELFATMQAEMTQSAEAAARPCQLAAEWTALDDIVTVPRHVLDVNDGLERLNRKLTPSESDQSRRALQWTLDQAWSAADLGDSEEFAKARRLVHAALERLVEDVNSDLDDHQRRIEMDRKRINECFEGVISDLADMVK